jgi:AcrR family transcriptional regulator
MTVDRPFCYCQAMSATSEKASARERLLDAAAELFYEEGVNSVGVDKIVERAGVAKASLYKLFGSKDELVRAYLNRRHDRTRERMMSELEQRFATPRERLIGVFEVQGLTFEEPGFRGCAFVSASAEARPGSAIEQATSSYRTWLHELFEQLAIDAGAPDPASLATQLVLLYDGAGISAWMDSAPQTSAAAATIATALIDAAIPAASTA